MSAAKETNLGVLGTIRTPTQVRAWTRTLEAPTRKNTGKRTAPRSRKDGIETEGPVLVFDTETTVTAAQDLTFGSWRFGYYKTGGRLTVLEEGLFHADDLAETDPEGFEALKAYAASHLSEVDRRAPGANPVLELISRSDFVSILFRAIQAGASIVNFNKPFDLTRIAIGAGEARGKRYGGFSLRLWENEYSRPRIVIKPHDSKSAFTELTRPPKIPLKPGAAGRFLDLRTLGFALDAKAYTLASACLKWKVENPKQKANQHGIITRAYIEYNRVDTRATAELCARMFADLERHPITAKPELLMSPAALAKKYLQAMGVQPRLRVQPDFPEDVLGAAMSTFYGGRAECRIRRTAMPVEIHDFTSMYPTVNTLMCLWRHHIAERIDIIDATGEVAAFLATVTLQTMFDPGSWPKLVGLVQLVAEGDVLPVRARYGRKGDETSTIAVNPYWSDCPQWFTIADAVASKLLTGKAPTIVQAIRFCPIGTLAGLTPVRLGGGVRVDPATDDFFKITIEERVPVKDQPLGAFLKVLANAGSYGIFAQFDRQDLAPHTAQQVIVDDGQSLTPGLSSDEDGSFTFTTQHPEVPGPYAFPPIAACITGAARLMLAMLERCVTDAGGRWVFGDTDSMAIVATQTGGLVACPGGNRILPDNTPAVLALSYEQTATIGDRFDRVLNPYDRTRVPDLLKSEYQGWCYAISAKRYACFTIRDGQVVVDRSKVSEHGLGHLMAPGMSPLADTVATGGVRPWIISAWEWMISSELELAANEPEWLDRPAVGRITITSAPVWRAFDQYNHDLPWREKIKPANFLLSIGTHPLSGESGRLVAPFEVDSTRWMDLPWYRPGERNGAAVSIGTDWTDAAKVPVETYRLVLTRHLAHPESKFLDTDGAACTYETRGLLERRPTISTGREIIGKEANRIEEVQAGLATTDPTLRYRRPRQPWELTVEVLRRTERGALLDAIDSQRRCNEKEASTAQATIRAIDVALPSARKAEKAHLSRLRRQSEQSQCQVSDRHPYLTRRQMARVLTDGTPPRQPAMRDFLIGFATRAAVRELANVAPAHAWAQERTDVVLEQYLALPMKKRTCTCGCGKEITRRQRWASDACRKRATRRTPSPN